MCADKTFIIWDGDSDGLCRLKKQEKLKCNTVLTRTLGGRWAPRHRQETKEANERSHVQDIQLLGGL